MERHLHYSRQELTVCGYRRWVPFRAGSRVMYVRGVESVHTTKARRTDCEDCRKAVRAAVRGR